MTNAVTIIAHNVLRWRGQSAATCTPEQLKSAYEKAERITESWAGLAERIAKRREREAA